MTATDELLGPILRDVSRAFYLTLRVLPTAVRPQIGLAYLLARIADTIADTTEVPAEKRRKKLRQFRERIRDEGAPPVDFSTILRALDHEGEQRLLQHSAEAIALLDTTKAADRGQIQLVLETITRGQELDLERFDGKTLTALQTADDLDDYTYRVAGCVGEFWTRITRQHCFPDEELDELHLVQNAIRFGKGLQLVNILRDLPADLAAGRCYLPAVDLSMADLEPADLREPKNWLQLEPVFRPWLELAEEHLAAGAHYNQQIPHVHYRLRLACAWPLLMGRRTLDRVRESNPLEPSERRKITRAQVRGILFGTAMRVPFRGAWQRLLVRE